MWLIVTFCPCMYKLHSTKEYLIVSLITGLGHSHQKQCVLMFLQSASTTNKYSDTILESVFNSLVLIYIYM